MTNSSANKWFGSPLHASAVALGLLLFSPGGPYLWAVPFHIELPWSLAISIALDVVAVLLAVWGMRSTCGATLACSAAAAVFFLWFGKPEAGPGAQLVVTYKYILLSAVGWLGWWRNPEHRLRWVSALIPTAAAFVLLITLLAPPR